MNIKELESALGDPSSILMSPLDLERYGRDWSRQIEPAAGAVVLPRSVEEVQAVIRWAAAAGVSIVPSGGRTGLSAGAVAPNGEVVLSMERMRATIDFNAIDRSLTVEAGVVTQTVQDIARSHELYYPVDFASRGSCQIGGNVATNAGGIKVLRYGLTRQWVSGLKVVTGTGELLNLNRGLVKNATGYDLRHLFIGSEGTLGVIVEVTLQLTQLPPPQQVMVVALPDLQSVMAVFASLRNHVTLSAFEFFTERALTHVTKSGVQRPFAVQAPYYVLAEFDADEAAAMAVFERGVADGTVLDAVLSQSDAQAAMLWRLREGITESIAPFKPYKNDISVRVSAVPEFLARVDRLLSAEYPEFEVVWFGHVGDGNLHISILPPQGLDLSAFNTICGRVTDQLGSLLAEFGGSVSAEHGVGILKKPYLHYSRSDTEIALMRQLKQVFDPAGILNPGKIF